MKKTLRLLLFYSAFITYNAHATAPLGMFVPYDINLRLKKPVPQDFQFHILGEKSFSVKGYATDINEEITFEVNPLQIYEPTQNLISMYQGIDAPDALYPQVLNSIAGGPGGGVSDYSNGLFTPTGKFSCGQVAFGATYGLPSNFYISAYLPVCFAKLSSVNWAYAGNDILFAGEQIQNELVNSFVQDSEKYFDLNVGCWKQNGIGDTTFLVEWQKDFPQIRRQLLRNVQANLRVGLSLPTGVKVNEHRIMSVPFGADGSVSLPFGGGLGINLGSLAEVGFSGQFWYFWSNQKIRRIKTFPTQTTLLFPTLAQTYKEFSFLQNFNLYAQLYTPSKRFSLKGVYQYWRKQHDRVTPLCTGFNFDVINTAFSLDEMTRHTFFAMAVYCPRQGDFKKVIPQFELFLKGTFGGTRAATACTYGAQLSLIF
ncbi:MAG: hypothetical protein NTU89_04465 [Candidatus Dependentiae bacterium]|nr:hypothetical protein [Candidatus Dependentiae bacterium]